MTEKYPRLLVASEFPPNASGGGPAVVRQMLKGWPVARLYWWSCLPERNPHFGQQVAAHRVAAIPQRWYPGQRGVALKAWLLEHLWIPRATRHLQVTLREFKPEVAWAIPHAWAIPPLARVLPAAGLAFHATIQDYMDSNAYRSRIGRKRGYRFARLVEGLYASAHSRDATSHPMIADLRARTGRAAVQMLHAGLEEEDFEYLNKRQNPNSRGLRIAYAGTVVAESAFALFVNALSRIRRQLPAAVTIEFFASHSYAGRAWFDPAWMHEHGNLPAAALTVALRECSWGFAPMSLSDDDPRYNHFSFPTKFISYLAAGLPVITLGHPQSSVMKMADAYGVGHCSSLLDSETLGSELLRVLAQPDARLNYRPAIKHCATQEFDGRRMRATLQECLRQGPVLTQ